MKFCYPAVFHRNEDGSFDVTFPDLEMCTAHGRTFEEALDRAKDAEEAWIGVELEDEMELPSISDRTQLELSEDDIYQNVTVNIRLMPGYDE